MEGYIDITVIWGGAVDEIRTYMLSDREEAIRFFIQVQAEAMDTDELVEVYTLVHEHSLDQYDCDCVQYESSALPDWTNERTEV